MARGRKVITFEEVEILDQWKSKKKGTACTKVGWNSKESSGQQMFYSEDELKDLPEGTVVTIKASQRGDFYGVIDVEVHGKVKQRTPSAAA